MPKRRATAKPIDAQTQWRRAKALELAIMASPALFPRGHVITGEQLLKQAEILETWLTRPTAPSK